MKLFTLILFLLPLSLHGIEEKVKIKAIDLLKPLKQNLMQTLQSEIKAKGIIGGIEACQIEAPKIAEALQEKTKKIELGRTSHKLRNSNNAPRDWVKPYLKEFVSSGKIPPVQVVRLSGERYGYLEPIMLTQPLCLQCHGNEIESEVMVRLKALYPNDDAAGFKMGEFRGLFWVEMDLTEI